MFASRTNTNPPKFAGGQSQPCPQIPSASETRSNPCPPSLFPALLFILAVAPSLLPAVPLKPAPPARCLPLPSEIQGGVDNALEFSHRPSSASAIFFPEPLPLFFLSTEHRCAPWQASSPSTRNGSKNFFALTPPALTVIQLPPPVPRSPSHVSPHLSFPPPGSHPHPSAGKRPSHSGRDRHNWRKTRPPTFKEHEPLDVIAPRRDAPAPLSKSQSPIPTETPTLLDGRPLTANNRQSAQALHQRIAGRISLL